MAKPHNARAGGQSVALEVQAILDRIEYRTYSGVMDMSGPGPATMARWLNRFSLEEVLAAVDESFQMHLKWDDAWDPDFPTIPSIKKAFHKVPSTAQRLIDERTRPWIGRLLYIQGIIRNRLHDRTIKVFDLLEAAHLNGVDLDDLHKLAVEFDTPGQLWATLAHWRDYEEAA
jgi:hypothetical protein